MIGAASLLWLTFLAGQAPEAPVPLLPIKAISATIDASEWDPPVFLTLDRASGLFTVTQIQPPSGRRGRQFTPLRSGSLSKARRDEVQTAFTAAFAGKLGKKAPCGEIVISNAGPVRLAIISGNRFVSTPSDLGCWSTEARYLHALLTSLFW